MGEKRQLQLLKLNQLRINNWGFFTVIKGKLLCTFEEVCFMFVAFAFLCY